MLKVVEILPMYDPLASPIHTERDAARVTGAPLETLRSRFKLDNWTTKSPDKTKSADRSGRRLTARTIIACGIAEFLTNRFNTEPRRAFEAAKLFAHIGNEERHPGYLFPTGETWLALGPHGAAVLHIDGAKSFLDVMYHIRRQDQTVLGALCIDLREIVNSVREGLGLPPDPLTGKVA